MLFPIPISATPAVPAVPLDVPQARDTREHSSTAVNNETSFFGFFSFSCFIFYIALKILQFQFPIISISETYAKSRGLLPGLCFSLSVHIPISIYFLVYLPLLQARKGTVRQITKRPAVISAAGPAGQWKANQDIRLPMKAPRTARMALPAVRRRAAAART